MVIPFDDPAGGFTGTAAKAVEDDATAIRQLIAVKRTISFVLSCFSILDTNLHHN